LLALAGSSVGSTPPDSPTNPLPVAAAEDVDANVNLCVDVTDPLGGPLDVTFYARDLTAQPAENFTIVFLPDTQYYAQSFPQIFRAQTEWIVENRENLNIVFVSHVGDIVQLGSIEAEWDNADAAMSLLEDPATTERPDGIPFSLSVGNHDQVLNSRAGSPGNPGETTVNFNQYFGLSRFEQRSYWGGNYDDNNDNNYQLFEAGGMEFIIIHHEFDNTYQTMLQLVLPWTDNLLSQYSDRRAIITSHSLLCNETVCPSYLEAEFSNQGLATYEALKHHKNLFLMHCGHAASSPMQPRRADTFDGHTIHTVLANYQRGEDCPLWCGNGWLRVMTFEPGQDRIFVQTYSPWLETYRSDLCADGSSCHEFELTYDMNQGKQFQSVGSLSSVPSGMSACVPWFGRQAGSDYEWYVDVSNASGTTTGPRWSFSSDAQCGLPTDCDDGDPCTTDACVAGVCSQTPIANCCETVDDCDDGIWCTDDACNAGTCSHVDNTKACDDGDPCTENDLCAGGICSGSSIVCDDANACTADACVGGVCAYSFSPTPACCSVDVDCDDGDRCTADSCGVGGECVHSPEPDCCFADAECEDFDVCTIDSCPPPNTSALALNGVDQNLTIGRAPGLNAQQFTLECWFKWDGGGSAVGTSGWPPDAADTGGIVAYPLVTNGRVEQDIFTHKSVNYFLGISESQLVLEADFEEHESGSSGRGTNHPVTGQTPVSVGVWHHAAVTYDGSCWELYLDGQPETNGTNCPAEPPAFETQSHVAIGTAQDFNGGVEGRFSGLIDEVRIWGRALDAIEIQAKMWRQIETDPDLLGRWGFNERTGHLTPDTSGNGHVGVLVHAGLSDADVADLSGGTCSDGYVASGVCGVAGTVYYYRDFVGDEEPSIKPVPNVEIDFGPDGNPDATTDESGGYSVDAFGSVTVAAMGRYATGQAADHNGAVTSLDAARIAQSVVDIVQFSANQEIAADVTGNGQVSSLDAARVAQFATEFFEHFPVAVTNLSDWAHLACANYVDADNHDCGPPQSSHLLQGQFETGDFYAVLYGDVTGNWAPAGSRSVEMVEAAVAAEDQRRAAVLRAAGVSLDIDQHSRRTLPAVLAISGLETPLAKGEQRQLTLEITRAEGIQALDLSLSFDSNALVIKEVHGIGLGNSMSLASNSVGERLRVALYGLLPLAGSGTLLSVTVEALEDVSRRLAISIDAEANEGVIPVRVRHRAPTVGPRSRSGPVTR
jgi:hypothetical protein